ncbi:DUF5667 domain-containing protein [Streptomyces sp. SID2888]|uniref:DUF5667 domain-containing protein n=1 Tax=Streptomyces sp. SID2888 TaxID=2690256 RepID=UPI00136C51BE|nr:hypothetical protein [Streptomyces sp. SID2888]
MIANVSAHRRANAFAQALEEQSDDRGTAAERPGEAARAPAPTAPEGTEQAGLLALATRLDELPRPELDPEVKVVQRAQLVAAMEAMLQEGTATRGEAARASVPGQLAGAASSAQGRGQETGERSPRGRGAHRANPLGKLRPRTRLTKGLAAGGLSVGVAAASFGGVAAASSDALPGDSLYGLKRGIEDVKLGMAHGDDGRGRLYLDQASTRLNEARRLMERGRSGDLDHESLGEIRRTLSGMQHDASEGHRLLHEAYERDGSLAPIQALSAFSQSHRETWGALRDRLPVQLGDVSQQVSSVFDAIDQEVAPLRSLLPQPPSQGGSDRPSSPTASDTTGGSPGTDSPTPSAGGEPSTGSHSSGTPEPSASTSSGDGLLGGNTGDLLDPPKESTGASPSGSKSPSSGPNVTLPPLLPGLLPGLGIDSEDTK